MTNKTERKYIHWTRTDFLGVEEHNRTPDLFKINSSDAWSIYERSKAYQKKTTLWYDKHKVVTSTWLTKHKENASVGLVRISLESRNITVHRICLKSTLLVHDAFMNLLKPFKRSQCFCSINTRYIQLQDSQNRKKIHPLDSYGFPRSRGT